MIGRDYRHSIMLPSICASNQEERRRGKSVQSSHTLSLSLISLVTATAYSLPHPYIFAHPLTQSHHSQHVEEHSPSKSSSQLEQQPSTELLSLENRSRSPSHLSIFTSTKIDSDQQIQYVFIFSNIACHPEVSSRNRSLLLSEEAPGL